ncbi:hypothetical protein IJ750_07180 [bacterium]|nr:hypothetical protein [bacterium]
MKIQKIIDSCPIAYNRNNVTSKEFKTFLNWLAKNNIQYTFHEPDKFITEAERKESEEFQKHINYLAENGINKTFYC